MKKLEDVIENIKEGSIILINKNVQNEPESRYSSFIVLYDGTIQKDVKEIEVGGILNSIPNIKKELDKGYIYQVKYDREKKEFQNSILKEIIPSRYSRKSSYELVNDFSINTSEFITGLIELDTKIISDNSTKQFIKEYKI